MKKSNCAAVHRSSMGGRIAGPGSFTGQTIDFHVTGHGSYSGYYARFSWQDASASGNPAAYEVCNNCHDLDFPQLNASVNLPNPFHSLLPILSYEKEVEQ